MRIRIGKETFEKSREFHYENGFYLTSDPGRMAKLLAHYELYRMIKDIPGAIVECGVFKGASFIRFATFRDLFETRHARAVIGFDTYGSFPETGYVKDVEFRRRFTDSAGSTSISRNDLETVLRSKRIENYQLIPGDITKTVPEYISNNPQLKIALLHIDTDIYEPAVVILENMFDRISRGGVIAFDDYGTFPGETKAVDDFFEKRKTVIKKLPFSPIPCFVIKK